MDQLPIFAGLMGLAVICVGLAIYSIIVIERDRSGAMQDEIEALEALPSRRPAPVAHAPLQSRTAVTQREASSALEPTSTVSTAT